MRTVSDRALAAHERLDYLATLEFGWLTPEDGHPMHEDSIARAREFFNILQHALDHLPAPGIFPSPEGYVLVEWFFKDELWSIDFEAEETWVAIYDFSLPFEESTLAEHEGLSPQALVEFLVDFEKRNPKSEAQKERS